MTLSTKLGFCKIKICKLFIQIIQSCKIFTPYGRITCKNQILFCSWCGVIIWGHCDPNHSLYPLQTGQSGRTRYGGWSLYHTSYTTSSGVLFAFISSMEAVGIATGSAVYGNLYPTLFQQSYFLMAFLYLTPVLPLR